MKKAVSFILTLAMVFACSQTVFADSRAYRDSGSGDIVIETSGGKEIELVGHVEPTIISVVMPSYIPFDISKSQPADNKVVSPEINVTNNSNVPVVIYVDNARVDLSNLQGTSWSNSGVVAENQVAVGLTEAAVQPENLGGAKWLAQGQQNTELIRLVSQQDGKMFIVGAIGSQVPENQVFSVVPTLVVKQA